MVASTEERLARLEGAYEHLATKADLERAISSLTWRLVGIQILGIGIMIGVMRLLG